jgi:hypothetical protein
MAKFPHRNAWKSVTITMEFDDEEPQIRKYYADKDSEGSITVNIEQLWDDMRGVWVDGDRWNVELKLEAVGLEEL